MKAKADIAKIEGLLRRALESLRGSVTASEALRCVASLVLLRVIYERSLSSPRESASLEGSAFLVPEKLKWNSLGKFLGSPRLPVLLDKALEDLAHRNESLGAAFEGIRFEKIGSMSPDGAAVVSKLFEAVSQIDLEERHSVGGVDSLGGVADFILSRIAEVVGGRRGEYYVPAGVAALVAALLGPNSSEIILDPVCGSGSLLSSMARLAGSGEVYGQDWRTSLLSLCRISMVLNGAPGARIEPGNALISPMRRADGKLLTADVVVCNPPFGLRDWGGEIVFSSRPELFRYGLTPRSGSEFAFLSHALEAAREGVGRAAVIVSVGSLARQEDREVRKALVEQGVLVSVVALPPKLFLSTKIPVAILVLSKGKKRDGVIFVDASRSYEAQGRLNLLISSEIGRVADSVRSSRNISGFSRLVGREEIQSLDFNLTVSRYIEEPQGRPPLKSVDSLVDEMRKLEMELADVRDEIDRSLKSWGIEV